MSNIWSKLTNLGGLITGTLGISNGGTGQTTKAAAFDALSPMTTAGDVIYGGTAGTGTRLGIGAATTVLHGGASAPSFSQIVDADVSASAAISGSKLQAASGTNAGTVTWENVVTQATTFTFNGTGSPGTTGSVTITMSRVGRSIILSIPSNVRGTTGTTSTALTANTAMPTGYRPNNTILWPITIDNNGSTDSTAGYATIDTSGIITIQRSFTNTAWSNATANCGLASATTVAYVSP